MNIISIYRKVHHFRDKFEIYIHLFYSFILIIFSTGLMWAFYYEPLISRYHDIAWIDAGAKINKVEYAYQGYTEDFSKTHPAKSIDELKNINGKNTYFVFLDYDYQVDNKNLSGNYQIDSMSYKDKEKFFERIKNLKTGSILPLKINSNNYQINLPKGETKLKGREDDLFTPILWILGFYSLGIYYIRDFINRNKKSRVSYK